jgi:hypothetical protein
MAYPVAIVVEPSGAQRDRLTTALRPILAIPHAILVGPIYWSFRTGGVGLLGAAAYVMAIISWFTLLISGEHFAGIREFSMYYLRWRVKALAYMALFADGYPPFGEGAYPATISVVAPSARDRATIAVRPLLVLPHVVLLFFLMIGWLITTVIAWFAILFTGAYPAGLLPFGVGVMTWTLRVEAYLLLLVDEYPPFAFDEAGGGVAEKADSALTLPANPIAPRAEPAAGH